MTKQTDFFHNSGLSVQGFRPPSGTLRAYLRWGDVVGQYLFPCLMSALGIGLAVACLLGCPFPLSVPVIVAILALFGYIVYTVTRNDYAWVELQGGLLRARHLYTGKVVERSIKEIEEIYTLVLQRRTLTARIVEAWWGRVRGFSIRFTDHRAPFQVYRADPAMRNAKELMEAIVYKMAEKGEIAEEIVDLEGQPLVRRIYWKNSSPNEPCQ